MLKMRSGEQKFCENDPNCTNVAEFIWTSEPPNLTSPIALVCSKHAYEILVLRPDQMAELLLDLARQ
jgi:hypothetical protein